MLTRRSAAESICVCEKLTWFCHWRAEFPFQNLLVYSLSKFTKCFWTRMLLFIQVNGEFPFHQVGNLNEGRTIHQICTKPRFHGLLKVQHGLKIQTREASHDGR